MRPLQLCSTAILLTGTLACGGSSTAPSPTQASFTVTVVPGVINAIRCNPLCTSASGGAAAFSATMNVSMQETAGVGATLTSISFVAKTPAGGTLIFNGQPTLTFGPNELPQFCVLCHINPKGGLGFPLTFLYNTNSSTPDLSITVTVTFKDDQGNLITSNALVTVV